MTIKKFSDFDETEMKMGEGLEMVIVHQDGKVEAWHVPDWKSAMALMRLGPIESKEARVAMIRDITVQVPVQGQGRPMGQGIPTPATPPTGRPPRPGPVPE